MDQPPFRVALEDRGAGVVAVLDGELDTLAVGELEQALGQVRSGRCVLDLSSLRFIDSAGVHALMRLDHRARREGWALAVAAPHGPVARVLEVCRVGDRIELLPQLPGDLR